MASDPTPDDRSLWNSVGLVPPGQAERNHLRAERDRLAEENETLRAALVAIRQLGKDEPRIYHTHTLFHAAVHRAAAAIHAVSPEEGNDDD